MTAPNIVFSTALLLSAVYGFGYSWRIAGSMRLVTKMAAMFVLALFGLVADVPVLLVAAILAASVGDFLIVYGWNWTRSRLLNTCAAAFLACYVIQMGVFFTVGASVNQEFGMVFALALSVMAMGLVVFGKELMQVPVVTIFHGVVVVLIFTTAYTLPPAYWMAQLGTAMFFISGLLLGYEMFRLKATDTLHYIVSPAIWFTYFAGHVFIVMTFLP